MEHTETNPLTDKINQSHLPKVMGDTLMESFNPFWEQTEKWRELADKLVVTDASQTKEMEDARVARLALKNIRTSVEKKRKELKEDSLRTGQTIDSVANILKSMIEPIEKHLETQERFIFIQMEKQDAENQRVREEALQPFGVDVSFYNLKQMPESDFQMLLSSIKIAHENKIAEALRLEQERIANEEKQKKEQEKIRMENERLKKERQELELKMKKEKEKQDAKLKQEMEEKRKLQEEIDAREERERLQLEEQKKQERKNRNAPDVDKLLKFSDDLNNMQIPKMKTEEGQKISENVGVLLTKTVTYIRTQSDKLI